jgi:hypothetical protein
VGGSQARAEFSASASGLKPPYLDRHVRSTARVNRTESPRIAAFLALSWRRAGFYLMIGKSAP